MAASIEGGEGEPASRHRQGDAERFDHTGDPPNGSAILLSFTPYNHDLTLSWR
jgi:hypothetical protein